MSNSLSASKQRDVCALDLWPDSQQFRQLKSFFLQGEVESIAQMKPKVLFVENDEQLVAQIEHLEKELQYEREQNKDDITHLELLEKHYKEREKAYEEVKQRLRKWRRTMQYMKSNP
ncbi:hypothetical protein EDD22DRAFT_852290 [Suillus occidentalis]|nr:hypothetical protein EDD22DRAFT_852290 [Suillus occidentalis]